MQHTQHAPALGRVLPIFTVIPLVLTLGWLPGPPPAAALPDPTAQNNEYWVEAECAEGGEEWQPDTARTASHGSFVYFPGNGKFPAPRRFGGASQLTFTVELSESAEYVLFFRLNSPKSDRNSMWVSVDDGPWAKFWRHRDRSQLSTEGFEWREVAHDGKALDLRLGRGTHVIRVAARESGTELDKIFLAPVGRQPQGLGKSAPSCPDRPNSTLTSTPANRLARRSLIAYPNPVDQFLTLRLPSVLTEEAQLRLSGADGRVHGTYTLRAEDYPDGRYTLPTGALGAGVYAVTLTTPGSAVYWSTTFVRQP